MRKKSLPRIFVVWLSLNSSYIFTWIASFYLEWKKSDTFSFHKIILAMQWIECTFHIFQYSILNNIFWTTQIYNLNPLKARFWICVETHEKFVFTNTIHKSGLVAEKINWDLIFLPLQSIGYCHSWHENTRVSMERYQSKSLRLQSTAYFVLISRNATNPLFI